MPQSPEARAAASERMKKMHADKRAKKTTEKYPEQVGKGLSESIDESLQEALAKQPLRSAAYEIGISSDKNEVNLVASVYSSHITIQVDWEHLPMPEAQQFYAHLKNEFEKAGKILNSRSNARLDGYECFMCKKHFAGRPGFTDLSYKDPATGLFPRVDICGELCVINYNAFRINLRSQENIKRGAEERGEA